MNLFNVKLSVMKILKIYLFLQNIALKLNKQLRNKTDLFHSVLNTKLFNIKYLERFEIKCKFKQIF